MNDDRALAALPRAYRLALALHDLGADEHLIADCLEIESAAVGPLLEIGARKLQGHRASDPRTSGEC